MFLHYGLLIPDVGAVASVMTKLGAFPTIREYSLRVVIFISEVLKNQSKGFAPRHKKYNLDG
ncbi:MAG: hypothetical protein RLZZ339_2883 [Cyanobacteriota bacterium]|jgi:hypothetical protein